MDALEQVLYGRQPDKSAGLIHYSNRGLQYVSIKFSPVEAENAITNNLKYPKNKTVLLWPISFLKTPCNLPGNGIGSNSLSGFTD